MLSTVSDINLKPLKVLAKEGSAALEPTIYIVLF